jgi:hypothetical protein
MFSFVFSIRANKQKIKWKSLANNFSRITTFLHAGIFLGKKEDRKIKDARKSEGLTLKKLILLYFSLKFS